MGVDTESRECLDAMATDRDVVAVDEGPWDGSASNYTDAQYQAACAIDRRVCGSDAPPKARCSLPYKTPSGQVSRAGTHAAAARINQVKGACAQAVSAGKAKLRAAYRQLKEDPPDSLKGEAGAGDELAALPVADGAMLNMAGHYWAVTRAWIEDAVENGNPFTRLLSGDLLAHAANMAAGQRGRGPAVNGGVATLPLRGPITPRASILALLLDGSGGLAAFRTQLRQAVADPDVSHVVLDVDSPGGLVDQVPETAQAIRDARQEKPIVAVANTNAGSAAYWLASQAHEVVVTPSGEVGSIGVYTLHKDMSQALANMGVKPTLVSAGKYKVEGNPFEPLDAEAIQAAQESVDDFYDLFAADVAAGRGTDPQVVKDGYGEGRMLTAKRAVKAGLADRVATLQETQARLASGRARVKSYAAGEITEDGYAPKPETSATESSRNGEVVHSPEDQTRILEVLLS